MKIIATIARYLLGLMFTVFGLNGFLHFLPQPPLPAGPAGQFINALLVSHYFIFVCVVQVVSGLMFLTNMYVPLALVMIAPVIVNILLFHVTMEPTGLPPGVVAALLWMVLAFRCRVTFVGIFRRRMPA